jgi:hypothetical protein
MEVLGFRKFIRVRIGKQGIRAYQPWDTLRFYMFWFNLV